MAKNSKKAKEALMASTRLLLQQALCIALLISYQTIQAVTVITGDPNAAIGTTFSFPVGTYWYNPSTEGLVTGALSGTPTNYAVARWYSGTNSFTPLATQEAVINNSGLSEQNPLYNATIPFLGGIQKDKPVGVIGADLTSLFCIDKVPTSGASSVLVAFGLKDTTGTAITAGIVGISRYSQSSVLAAVLGNGQTNFGASDSGIAVAHYMNVKFVNQENNTETLSAMLVQLDAQEGTPTPPTAVRAVPFLLSSPFVAITNQLTSIANVVDIHWSSVLNRFYIALQIVTGAGAGSGGYAVVVGYLDPTNKLTLYPIAPSTIFTSGADDEIIGALGSSTSVTINAVRDMTTSTSISYLIVQGGNGDAAATSQTVYALPLVNLADPFNTVSSANNLLQGTLADVNQTPQAIFTPGASIPIFSKRVFTQTAQLPADIFTTGSTAAQVGGGPLSAGAITAIQVNGDVVYAFVGAPAANELPGAFYSRALFDADGAITAWTAWQRAGGSVQSSFFGAYDNQKGNTTFATGTNATSINTIAQTSWGIGDVDLSASLVTAIDEQLFAGNGGIQGLFDFPNNTPALHGIAVLAAVGDNIVILAQTGSTQGTTFTPTTGDFTVDQQNFTNGTITQTLPGILTPTLVTITGGELASLGALQAVEIARDGVDNGPNGYLFVGGTNGVAVLCNANGTGWNTTTGLGNNFNGLVAGMSFKPVGNYTFVRSITADEGFLYVLTDSTFDRIDLNASDFATNTLTVVTLATSDMFASVSGYGAFTSVVISNNLAVLGTSTGLWRTATGTSVQTITTPSLTDWTSVPLALGIIPPTQLYAYSVSGRTQDVAEGSGGLLYVLDTFIGQNNGRLHRLAITDATGGVTDSTVVPLQDYNGDILAYYANTFGYRDIFYLDGSIVLNSRNTNLPFNLLFQNGFGSGVNVMTQEQLNGAQAICAIERSSASGGFVVGANTGLFINE